MASGTCRVVQAAVTWDWILSEADRKQEGLKFRDDTEQHRYKSAKDGLNVGLWSFCLFLG